MQIQKDAVQMLITKLDLNQITVKEVKEFCSNNYNLEIKVRTKEQVIRFLCKQIKKD